MENQDFSLHEAVRLNDIERAHDIIKSDPSCVNDWNLFCESPLHLVYKVIYSSEQHDERLPMVQLLLDYGADINAFTGSGETPLYFAVTSNQFEGVKLLLENGADPNLWAVGSNSVLHAATSSLASSDKIVRLLLKHGAAPNAFYDDETPLDYVIRNGLFDFMQLFMDAGAKSSNLYVSLVKLSTNEKTDMIKFVLNHANSMYLRDKFSVESLLFFLSSSDHLYFMKSRWNCNEKLIERLPELGFDINTRIQEGRTALHIAARNEEARCVLALLKAGADVNAKTFYGDTPLHFLLGQRRRETKVGLKKTIDIVKLLLQYGADVKALNHFGHTPFQMALKIENLPIVNLMLSKITDVTITNKKWVSRLSKDNKLCELCVAATLGYEKVVDRLIDMKYYFQNQDVFTNVRHPLFYAISERQFNIVKMLLEADFRLKGYYSHHLFFDRKHDDVDFKLVCLLFEYNVVSILEGLFRSICQSLIDIITTENKLLFLVVLYYARDLHLKKLNKEFIPMRGVFKSNKELSAVLALCNDKLKELKEDKLCDRLSKFDVLSMELDSLVKFLKNEDCIEACRNLSATLENQPDLRYDEYIIKFRIDLVIEKREALDSAKNILSRDLQGVLKFIKLKVLPDEILWKILSYFNMRELKKYSVEEVFGFDTDEGEGEEFDLFL